MEENGKPQNFRAWLEGKRERIMSREAEALKLLDRNDCEGYQKCMRQKAELLAALYEEAKSCGLMEQLPTAQAEDAESSLDRFSNGARTAIHLNSTFYMSALLYPDDHKNGEPDNLQRLIDRLS